ncbi:MAG: anthranilate synthase component I family protein [Deltaproteobacteria bacterium]|nr:anthranilate synthase component I family protein [Deltaproteobacteria bacterium]
MIREIAYCPLEERLPEHGPYVLLKTARLTPWDRWSILGWDPWLTWTPQSPDPFAELEQLLTHHSTPLRAGLRTHALPVPLLMGAIAYDAGRAIERIPNTARRLVRLPDAILFGFLEFLLADEQERRAWRITQKRVGLFSSSKKSPTLFCELSTGVEHFFVHRTQGLASNFTPEAYRTAVQHIRGMIAAGDCYQVNLSQQFYGRTPRFAAAIFRDAVARNPAPMMALVDAGPFQLISTSPERLLSRVGDRLVSRPIKGTRARDAAADRDRRLREELLADSKEGAELAMIVDLVRNDLGRVARAGSVVVAEPRVVESYANVHHQLATVTAAVRPDTGWAEILRAVFPGGSVTGCPKAQSMLVIESMEGVRRGLYCGSIGYLTDHGDGDWNIAIRTMTKIRDHVVFNVGGGVVYDSDPQAEYEETLQKGRTLFAIAGSAQSANESRRHT